jgi:hypothetical protein
MVEIWFIWKHLKQKSPPLAGGQTKIACQSISRAIAPHKSLNATNGGRNG